MHFHFFSWHYFSFASLLSITASAPVLDLQHLNSSVTILTHNDLYQHQSDRIAAALLLSSFQSHKDAQMACSLLSEDLWSASSSFKDGLQDALTYQRYLGNIDKDALFWIKSNGSCSGIDIQGRQQSVQCGTRLQSLCSQSAPLSDVNSADHSVPYQVSQRLEDSSITGYRDTYAWRFLGIRFANQPARFSYSQIYHPTANITALDYGVECLQAPGIGSEDCLFLNIWTPVLPAANSSENELKPVMLWLFGGGFVGGSANDYNTDGTNIASRGDVVVVEPNYRLGNFGWLALDDSDAKGNYGLSDMIAALQWVQTYIKYFGGDPARVTILGQSAGAASIRALLASPQAEGLFHQSIMESGPAGFSILKPYAEYQTVQEEMSSVGNALLNQTGCYASPDRLACLRNLDAQALISSSAIAEYPVIDDYFLTSSGLAFAGNATKQGPLLIGHVRDEDAVALPYPPPANYTAAIVQLSQQILDVPLDPATIELTFPLYNPDNLTQAIFNQTARLTSDGAIRCLSQSTAYSGSKHGTFDKIFYYSFNRTYQPTNSPSLLCNPIPVPGYPYGNPQQNEYFKCHAGEVPYAFGNILRSGMPDRDGLDTIFAQLIVDSWSAFARNGDPNPSEEYLDARGYTNTTQQLHKSGQWPQVDWRDPKERVLQMDTAFDKGFVDGEQCVVLGLPLDYYEKNV